MSRLVVFAVLATGAAALWGRLVTDPPVGRLAVVVGVSLLGAATVASQTRLVRFPVLARWAGILAALATIGAGAVALGVPVRLLWLPHWPELLDNIRIGLGGIEDAELPYAGADPWVRLTLLLGAPALLGLAAAVAFWPSPRRQLHGALGLAVLLVAWGVPATLDSPPAELAWGLLLLVLCGAWLWVPEIARRDLVPAAAALGAAGVLALPAAAAIDRERPLWDYESWNWFGRSSTVGYDWNHSYGPLQWPRDGSTLLEVRSPRPLYWKTTVLDRFDGFTWQRAQTGDGLASPELTARTTVPKGDLAERNPKWLTHADIEIRALRSEVAVGAGVTLGVDGIDDPVASPDGTLLLRDELKAGDAYSIDVYAPRPREARMRRASHSYPERLRGATLAALPVGSGSSPEVGLTSSTAGAAAGDEDDSADLAPSRAISFGLWGDPEPEAVQAALASEYASLYRLARRLTVGAQSAYDAARQVETHLRTSFDYTEDVPEHTYPLSSFLFADQAGYCQQFSGAMALMLRMVGIPSRVASGFAPGSYDAGRGVYEVRDYDAHSWVEVFIRGVGWVTFDPTPGAAPAASQAVGGVEPVVLREDGAIPELRGGRTGEQERGIRGGAPAAPADHDTGPWGVVGLGAFALAAAAVAWGIAWRRRRRLVSGGCAERQVAELVVALRRLGWSVEPAVTLLGIETRFDRAARRPIARYAAALRTARFARPGAAPPGPAARRELRRALAAGGGPGRKWRALRAIPPGGPAA